MLFKHYLRTKIKTKGTESTNQESIGRADETFLLKLDADESMSAHPANKETRMCATERASKTHHQSTVITRSKADKYVLEFIIVTE